jgi:soluble lytic murein transglycosylase-like protein
MMKMALVVAFCFACAGCETVGADGLHHSSIPLVQLTVDKAQEHNVPSSLAIAVVTVESNWDAKALSSGNYGLGQIKCGTARGIGFNGKCAALLEPEVNLEYSMTYMRMALDEAQDDQCRAATLYNEGLGKSWRNKPSRYCRKVMKIMQEQ